MQDIKQRAYKYALCIIKLIEELPRDISSQTISKQLLRSATSIGANMIEAKASGSRRDFTNFYRYSLKSANESLFWLNLLKDTGKAKEPGASMIIGETNEIARILASSIISLKGKANL